MDFLPFLGKIDPKSKPFIIHAFLGHMNQSFGTVYFHFFYADHNIYTERWIFFALLGYHDLLSVPMDYLSFLGRSGHICGRVYFNAFLGLRNNVFNKREP